MVTPYEPYEETRRAYHSGLSGKVIYPENAIPKGRLDEVDRTITFRTAKYGPPHEVALRSDLARWDGDFKGRFAPAGKFDRKGGEWKFDLPARDFGKRLADGPVEFKFVLDGTFWNDGPNLVLEANERVRSFDDFRIVFAYTVEFQTDDWRPNHLITIRNSDDGWFRDVFGTYRDGRWRFLLDRNDYSDAFEAKLVLDQFLFMNGANLAIDSGTQLYELDGSKVSFSATPTAFKHGYDNLVAVESQFEQISVKSVGREDDLYDVIVIGSGIGGGTLADALSDRGAKTLVLEAGGLRLPLHMYELTRSQTNYVGRDELGHYVNTGHQWFVGGVHFNLGGRSVYWSGLIPRMQDWEFRSVWPAAVKDYLLVGPSGGKSGYTRAEELMRLQRGLGDFQDDVREHLTTALSPDFVPTDLPRSLHQPQLEEYRRTTGTFSSTDLLLNSLNYGGKAGRDNLRVNLHHLATKIDVSPSGEASVECHDLAGHVDRTFRGKYVVLACGSIETPKLALNSGLTDPHAKMGVGLTDHPAYFYQIYHELPTSGPLAWIGDPTKHAKIMIRHVSPTVSSHAYHIELLINGRLWDARHADEDLWVENEGKPDVSRVEIKFIFDSELRDNNKVTAKGIGQKPEVAVWPNPSAETYKNEMVAVRNQVLTAVGVPVGHLSTTWIDGEWSQGIYGTVHHAAGTMRMSHDGTGVVDENLKLEAYDNLYCCDVSVYPSVPAANPSLTLAALALRLSDTLAAALGLP